ncbi:MAG: adenosylmethionine decarboxylase [Planctomycetaceae bacterium]|nr:adenosylmethionine decarboxylase [Planctomycetaceae bacterium]
MTSTRDPVIAGNLARAGLGGTHLLADLFGVHADLLTEEQTVTECLLAALRKSGFNVLSQCSHKFPGAGSGVTAVALLSESHAAIHTYPEHGYVAVDVFSCGMPDPEVALAHLRDVLRPTRICVHTQTRGESGG